jgi:hypothetical protein
VDIQEELNPTFEREVSVYVYRDQLSFVKSVFGWDHVEMNVAGLADHVRSVIYITSIYDTCKPEEHMKRMPIHELTHLIFHSNTIWIREGVADYEAGLLREFDIEKLPSSIKDLNFNGNDFQREEAYNFAAWIIKYIAEKHLNNDTRRLPDYISKHVDRDGRILPDEGEFFSGWKTYMKSAAW